MRCDARRLSFAVADGVGSSFLGDVAAQILSAHLADWLVSATAPAARRPARRRARQLPSRTVQAK